MIASMMECPVKREADFEKRMNRMVINCKTIKEEWAAPNLQDKYWQAVRSTFGHISSALPLLNMS